MSFALVTGAAIGIGREIALALCDAGYDLFLHYRSSRTEAEQLAEECREKGRTVHLVQSDLADPASVKRLIVEIERRKEPLYAIVNNVGEYPVKPLSQTSSEEWTRTFQANLHAPVAITHAFLEPLIAAKGRVINIGCAGLSGTRAAKRVPLYRCTKVAMLSWTRSLAVEMISQGVTVNMVSPGRMENSVDLTPERLAAIPAGRPGPIKDVARTVAWLLASENEYITGQNIEVAGGHLL